MQLNNYIYSFGYGETESDLCKLESKSIFKTEEKNKILFSDIDIDPASSAFIKKKIQITSFSNSYGTLLNKIKDELICVEGFKVEYLVLIGDTTEYDDRLDKLRDIGFSIKGIPNYYNPTRTYALCYYKGIWYFGILIKNSFDWYKHKKKPHSYSNSITINIAKALVNIAAKANKEKKLIDACCGAGTIMLEACFAGYDIEGCDINWKLCRDARTNISNFNYIAKVYLSDIKDISKTYDAAIVDLPYNLFSTATDNQVLHIMESVSKITDRLVIVSIADVTDLIKKIGFSISDYCIVRKTGKKSFARKIWVCEKY